MGDIIWDDLNRQGDIETFAEFVAACDTPVKPPEVAFCQTSKTVGLICTELFRTLRFCC